MTKKRKKLQFCFYAIDCKICCYVFLCIIRMPILNINFNFAVLSKKRHVHVLCIEISPS